MAKKKLRDRTTIGAHMTATPHSVGREQTLDVAHRIMREHGIRHLPVLHAGKLAGIVTQRDLYLVETLKDAMPDAVLVEEAMAPETYAVQANEALEDVIDTMAERKYGCAVILEGDKVVGVFTTTDALRLLRLLVSS